MFDDNVCLILIYKKLQNLKVEHIRFYLVQISQINIRTLTNYCYVISIFLTMLQFAAISISASQNLHAQNLTSSLNPGTRSFQFQGQFLVFRIFNIFACTWYIILSNRYRENEAKYMFIFFRIILGAAARLWSRQWPPSAPARRRCSMAQYTKNVGTCTYSRFPLSGRQAPVDPYKNHAKRFFTKNWIFNINSVKIIF